MIIIKKLFLLFCLCFLFNIGEIDSNNDKVLLYDKEHLYDENNFKVYFVNTNSNELKNILKILDIRVLSYMINDEKYYARDIDDLINNYIEDKSLQEKIYYENYGIQIDGINIMSNTEELLKLEALTNVY